jgi:hypothetical protein
MKLITTAEAEIKSVIHDLKSKHSSSYDEITEILKALYKKTNLA